MSKSEGSIIRFMFGVVSGLATGLILGLLTAPKTGKETRVDLSYKARELKDKAKEKFAGLHETGLGSMSRVKTTLQEKASIISSKLDELAKRGSDVLIQDEVH